MKTLLEICNEMPQISAYGIKDIRETERICRSLNDAHAFIKSLAIMDTDYCDKASCESIQRNAAKLINLPIA